LHLNVVRKFKTLIQKINLY